jgi:hypothetical protein
MFGVAPAPAFDFVSEKPSSDVAYGLWYHDNYDAILRQLRRQFSRLDIPVNDGDESDYSRWSAVKEMCVIGHQPNLPHKYK